MLWGGRDFKFGKGSFKLEQIKFQAGNVVYIYRQSLLSIAINNLGYAMLMGQSIRIPMNSCQPMIFLAFVIWYCIRWE